MTYQSPGLLRRSFLSAAAGSSSSSALRRLPRPERLLGDRQSRPRRRRSAASALSVSTASTTSAITSTDSPEAVSPSKVVTVVSPLSISARQARSRQPNTSSTSLARPRSTTADQRHHEDQEHQHHRGVADHLLAVGPDHLAQLGDDLLEVVQTKRIGLRDGPSFFGLALSSCRSLFLADSASAESASDSASAADSTSSSATVYGPPRPLAGGTLPARHDGGLTDRLGLSRRCRCRRLRRRHCRARRSPHAFRLFGVWSPSSVHIRCIQLQQGRQDLNLQPAVLETAALPVELRPFSGRLTRHSGRASHNSRAPRSVDRETDGQRAEMGKPRGPSVHRPRTELLIRFRCRPQNLSGLAVLVHRDRVVALMPHQRGERLHDKLAVIVGADVTGDDDIGAEPLVDRDGPPRSRATCRRP